MGPLLLGLSGRPRLVATGPALLAFALLYHACLLSTFREATRGEAGSTAALCPAGNDERAVQHGKLCARSKPLLTGSPEAADTRGAAVACAAHIKYVHCPRAARSEELSAPPAAPLVQMNGAHSASGGHGRSARTRARAGDRA